MNEWFKARNIWAGAFNALSDAEAGRLAKALWKYTTTGEQTDLSGREMGSYAMIVYTLQMDEQYNNEISESRRQAGNASANKRKQNQQMPTSVEADQQNQQMLTNVDIENKNKNKNQNKNYINTTTNSARAHEETVVGDVILDPLIIKVQQELNGLTDHHYQALNDYRQELGDDLVSYAIDSAVGNGVRNWNYVQAILQGFTKDGIRSIGEAKTRDEKRREEKEQKKQAPVRYEKPPKIVAAQRYIQREYSEKKLENDLGVNDIFAADWDGKL